jgi:predicted 3-demethylubiquinone-9 3-methyltransferase (glyoxalase superfamily)
MERRRRDVESQHLPLVWERCGDGRPLLCLSRARLQPQAHPALTRDLARRGAGDVILVTFTLGGQSFQALNGGAPATYGTAASISVECSDQAEVDRLWTALTADGGSEIMCGWLRDRWGVPWQIVPEILPRLLADPDPTVSGRVFAAMTEMVKLDIAALERAAAG